tara:strand:- start:785 stop:1000 length:216 start_codon:yes stop_codon:yes gene_type:complete
VAFSRRSQKRLPAFPIGKGRRLLVVVKGLSKAAAEQHLSNRETKMNWKNDTHDGIFFETSVVVGVFVFSLV